MEITNNVDAVLLQLLSALVARARFKHREGIDREGPFNDVIGTLARNRLRNAVQADGASDFRSYRLAPHWESVFPEASHHHEHVVPVHWWKPHLFHACGEEAWKLDAPSLLKLRELCARLYLTALVPKALHKALLDDDVGWHPTGTCSDWSRYQSDSVTHFLKRQIQNIGKPARHLHGFKGLKIPTGMSADDQEADFIVWRKSAPKASRVAHGS
jgi:hypothetical protein